MQSHRREVWFSGRVQGVGFRYTTHRLAANFDVTGFVENLPDGRVHLLVEALPHETSSFVEAICEKMRGNIVKLDQNTTVATHEYESFEILR